MFPFVVTVLAIENDQSFFFFSFSFFFFFFSQALCVLFIYVETVGAYHGACRSLRTPGIASTRLVCTPVTRKHVGNRSGGPARHRVSMILHNLSMLCGPYLRSSFHMVPNNRHVNSARVALTLHLDCYFRNAQDQVPRTTRLWAGESRFTMLQRLPLSFSIAPSSA